MKIFLRLCICFTTMLASAQHLVDQKTFDAIANEYSGEAAQENTRRIVEYHRIQGSPMMSAVAEQVVLPRLKAAGLECQDRAVRFRRQNEIRNLHFSHGLGHARRRAVG